MKFKDYLKEKIVPHHKRLLQRVKPTRDWRGAVEQLERIGATEHEGYNIVAQYHVIDETGKEVKGSPQETLDATKILIQNEIAYEKIRRRK